MASTSHDHSALRPCMVQLVCGSPFKQGRQVINADRSSLDVFEALEWSKGYSLLRVELCESLNVSTLPYRWQLISNMLQYRVVLVRLSGTCTQYMSDAMVGFRLGASAPCHSYSIRGSESPNSCNRLKIISLCILERVIRESSVQGNARHFRAVPGFGLQAIA